MNQSDCSKALEIARKTNQMLSKYPIDKINQLSRFDAEMRKILRPNLVGKLDCNVSYLQLSKALELGAAIAETYGSSSLHNAFNDIPKQAMFFTCVNSQYAYLSENYSFFRDQIGSIKPLIDHHLTIEAILRESESAAQLFRNQTLSYELISELGALHAKVLDFLVRHSDSVPDFIFETDAKEPFMKDESSELNLVIPKSESEKIKFIMDVIVQIVTILAFCYQLISGTQDTKNKRELYSEINSLIEINQQIFNMDNQLLEVEQERLKIEQQRLETEKTQLQELESINNAINQVLQIILEYSDQVQ